MQFCMLPVPYSTTEQYKCGSRGCKVVHAEYFSGRKRIRNVIAYLVNEFYLSCKELILCLSRDLNQYLIHAVLNTTSSCVCKQIQTCLCINRAAASALKSLHSFSAFNILHHTYHITLPLSILMTSANSQELARFFIPACCDNLSL